MGHLKWNGPRFGQTLGHRDKPGGKEYYLFSICVRNKWKRGVFLVVIPFSSGPIVLVLSTFLSSSPLVSPMIIFNRVYKNSAFRIVSSLYNTIDKQDQIVASAFLSMW